MDFPVLDILHNGMHVRSLSHVQLFGAPWTLVRQSPLSLKFSNQEYCGGLPFPPTGDLPDPGIEPVCLRLQYVLHWQADSFLLHHLGNWNHTK